MTDTGTPNPDDTPNDNPAWADVLEDLPDDIQVLLKPKLAQWDKTVQDKLEEARASVENPYAPLAEHNIPLDRVEQALWLAQQLESNPADIVQKAIESFNLDFVPKGQQVTSEPEDEDNPFEGIDLEKHPAFKAMMEKVEAANAVIEAQQAEQQDAAQAEELDAFLEELHKGPDGNNRDFDDLFVTALMANGVDPEEAVERYNSIFEERLKSVQQPPTPPSAPVVMGGDGNVGSGMPDQPVRMGSLSKNSINELAEQFLQQAAQSDSTG